MEFTLILAFFLVFSYMTYLDKGAARVEDIENNFWKFQFKVLRTYTSILKNAFDLPEDILLYH